MNAESKDSAENLKRYSQLIKDIAVTTGVEEVNVNKVVEEFLARLHKMEYEKKSDEGGVVQNIWWQISNRAYYHLLGFIESRAEPEDSWYPGMIYEILGRMPPCDRWEKLSEEMKDWKSEKHP